MRKNIFLTVSTVLAGTNIMHYRVMKEILQYDFQLAERFAKHQKNLYLKML